MKIWINFIAFQLVWFAAVGGAGHGYWWAGPVALVAFVAWHLRRDVRARGDFRLMWIALALGFGTDTLMAAARLSEYASAVPPAPLAPFWILSLWAGFALTLNHSMRWLTARPLLLVPLAAVIGPTSYFAAGRVWGAVTIVAPAGIALGVLGLCWFVAMSVLCVAARRLGRAPDDSIPLPLMRAP
ncbi:MAG TPA: DUF2878 domain-containing protein [Dokdonella sp.]|nr:DUF2878 domain-containing protein [Dokdonella sp.]